MAKVESYNRAMSGLTRTGSRLNRMLSGGSLPAPEAAAGAPGATTPMSLDDILVAQPVTVRRRKRPLCHS